LALGNLRIKKEGKFKEEVQKFKKPCQKEKLIAQKGRNGIKVNPRIA